MDLQFTLSTIREAAAAFWKAAGNRNVFAFHGPMGTGKTTFIRSLCEAKGVTSAVSSPTFAIINEYEYPGGIIFHIDLYRLRDEEEAIRAGVEDCLYSGQICLVEWPEKAPGILPENTVSVHFATPDAQTRKISIVY